MESVARCLEHSPLGKKFKKWRKLFGYWMEEAWVGEYFDARIVQAWKYRE